MAPITLLILNISGNERSQRAVDFYRQAKRQKIPLMIQPFYLIISHHSRIYPN
jgi:hypothetical protein